MTAVSLAVLGSPVISPAANAAPSRDDASSLRVGVLALAGAISAVGQTPELSEPLPFTTTSLADVLDLDGKLTSNLTTALTGRDLEDALDSLDGIELVDDGNPDRITFRYSRTVTNHELALVNDDGDLRFGPNDGAGTLDVSLTTRASDPFVVAVDENQPDPLLRVALVSQPVMDLSVDIDNQDVQGFGARQGFTDVDVRGGKYTLHKDREIVMRDPDGRGLLTLEDLRFSTLPDLFRITPTGDDVVDVLFRLALPASLAGGAASERTGTLRIDSVPAGKVWPTASDATRSYGGVLAAATDLSMVDGLSSLAQYTGTVLALQDAAEVPFPNLGGGTADLFAPGDKLLELLSTAATAQIRCGAAPDDVPAGAAAPGDSVYCNAVTPDGMGAVSNVSWSTRGGDGVVATADTTKAAAIGPAPTEVVRVDGSDGEPDLAVTFTVGTAPKQQTFTARTVPHTVQDVVRRIKELPGSTASASLGNGRLDVAVDVEQATGSKELELGNPGTLGALVGLTGLSAPEGKPAAKGTATATGSSFDVGFGIQTGTPSAGASRATYLIPADTSLLRIGNLSATAPTDQSVQGLEARIGFLGVTADLTGLQLGRTPDSTNAVSLDLRNGATSALQISDLLTEEGALRSGKLDLTNNVTADIAFSATESEMPGGGYATGGTAATTGGASVHWGPAALPTVGFTGNYPALRTFDPVPATFLSGTATVDPGDPDGPDDKLETTADNGVADKVNVDVTLPPSVTSLYEALNVPEGAQVEVARRLLAEGASCQNVLLVDGDTLTCDGLTPEGVAALDNGPVELIVLGDPFAMRDSVIEGFAAALSSFDRIDGDNRTGDGVDDQYTSTLPLVDLTPAQLAVEREGIRAGLAAMSEAAAEDEISAEHGTHQPVSSAQELARNIGSLMPGDAAGADLDFVTGSADKLGITLTAGTPTGRKLQAPLRFNVNGPGQIASINSSDGKSKSFDVGIDSDTTLAIDVVKATARPAVTSATGTVSTATLDLAGEKLRNESFLAGVGSLVTTGDDNAAHLGVKVTTSFDATSGLFRTTRDKARTGANAAEAHLVTPGATPADPDLVIDYTAAATDSSGGTGAVQPAPSALQVQFLAEGLDGLAAAVDSAMDGSAPRNLGPGGAPISAPLIGTDLDAGAGVADTLTGLTSELRDQLELIEVDEDTTATQLSAALKSATEDALAGADGLSDTVPAVDVSVTCDDADRSCSKADGPTEWNTVAVSTTVTGADRPDGKAKFETGLAGLAVHSDDEVDTNTSWSLPVTLQLQRGSGPQVVIGNGDALTLAIDAALPEGGVDAVVGYLPAHLDAASDTGGKVSTTVNLDLDVDESTDPRPYDLFDLYDGDLAATPSFSSPAGHSEDGLELDFQTLATKQGVLDLSGTIGVPWDPQDETRKANRGYGEVTYEGVQLDVGKVVAGIATPFKVVDPYLAPVRDIVEVIRTPIPVISDLSELAGGDEVSLLSLLETVASARGDKRLELAHRVIGLVDGVTSVMHAAATFGNEKIALDDLENATALLSIPPRDVSVHESCTQSMTTTTTTTKPDGTTTSVPKKTRPEPCPDDNIFKQGQRTKGAAGQTTNANRTGSRAVKQNVSRKSKSVTGQIPGFSMPFLTDPDQIVDLLTGEGEASYFRLDFGTLAAQVAYTQRFGPIMAGPVPIMPFVGGSISVEGRLAMGFDSYPQTLAVAQLSSPGAASELLDYYTNEFDGGDVIREGFYIDDLDADGVDVPEVKLVTTLEAGAGVSIGIVTAGLKGGITLTLNLDLNDPDDSGRLRASEIRDIFDNDASCIFDASGEIEAFISVFVEIELLLTTLNYDFDLLRLGPYTLFEYGCPDELPRLVVPVKNADDKVTSLALTSGSRSDQRISGGTNTLADEFEVRQFDDGNVTSYEVSGFGRVQRVDVTRKTDGQYSVTIFDSAISVSTDNGTTYPAGSSPPTFVADGGANKDVLSFLPGETFDDDGDLVTTPFRTAVTSLTGGDGDDTLTTGDGDDRGIDGGAGADTVDTGLGDDVATGGADNDIIGGGAGRDDLSGGTGSDRIEGGPGGDRASGGDGADSLVGGPGRDVRAVLVLPQGAPAGTVERQVRLGFDSGDVLVGGAGGDNVDGGDGSDVVVGGVAAGLTGGEMKDLFETNPDRKRTVNVLDADNRGEVTTQDVNQDAAKVPDDDDLDGLCESGPLESGSGTSDFVTGGPEADYVIGGNGADRLDGGAGPDEICGRAGDDDASGDGATSDAGDNADVIRGGHGSDRLDAGLGDDEVYGDDVVLFRDGARVLDGSLGGSADGEGDDHLDGGDGDDVLSGGGGSDLVFGGAGNDISSGEGRDTREHGGTAPPVSERLVSCNVTTRVVNGKVDVNGDLLAGAGGSGVTSDDGRLAGLAVRGGVVHAQGTGDPFSGLLGDAVLVDGMVDLDRNGTAGSGDTGIVPLASMLDTGDNSNGDCLLSEEGDDELLGGLGSDYLGAGDGTDLASGGDGNDLVLGDDGVDVVLGGPHHDVLVGGLGDDHLAGEGGDDRLRGNEGADDLVGGSDTSARTDGQDVLLGGRERDVLAAENADLVSGPIVDAVTADTVPWTDEAIVPDAVTAGADSELRFEESAVVCGGDAPDRWVTLLAGDGDAGVPAQSPGTPLAYDELYGGFDCDWVFGSEGDDVVRGGQDDDVVEGGPGADRANGDDGDDFVLGGSSVDPEADQQVTVDRSGAGVPDGGDIINGDGGPDGLVGGDLVAGDNALPVLSGSSYVVQLFDVPDGTAPAAGTSGPDEIDGGGASDRVFGQGGDDTITTGSGDDYVEGNDGDDSVESGRGDDDVVGGSSAANGLPLGTDGSRLGETLSAAPYDDSASGVLDGDDAVDGGTGADVVLGDNGRITRPDATDATARDIALTDESSGDTSGVDRLTGGADADRIYGQDDDDRIEAGSGDDYVEGNSGSDTAAGDADADVVIGGSSVSPAGDGSVTSLPTVTIPDAGDTLFGDDPTDASAIGKDRIFGDNATVLPLGARWVVKLADVRGASAPAAGTSGDDTVFGGASLGTAGSDHVFGQGGDDTITTSGAPDYVEGNTGDDTLSSGAGNDDVLGGSSALDGRPYGTDGQRLQQPVTPRRDSSAAGVADGVDTIRAGADDDTVLGDNGRITRPPTGPSPDVAMADAAAGATSGSDRLYGEDGHDVLYGQLDDGAAGDWGTGDRLDGGSGNDALLGDLAVVVRTAAAALSAPRTLALKSEAVSESVYGAGSVVPRTYVPDGLATTGGPDLAKGGTGDDVLHLGGGADLGNGDAGADAVFGGDADDAVWGGLDHDRLFGGYGADMLDVKKRSGDPGIFNTVRGLEDRDADEATANGADLAYGGWGPDELQADVGGTGQQPATDVLVDWVGAHNVYYVCGGAYGQGRIVRTSSPGMEQLMLDLARAVGSEEVADSGRGGWYDVGMVYNGDNSKNTQKHPDHPGHFTCG